MSSRERSSAGSAGAGAGAHGGRPPPYNPDAHHAPPPPYSASHAYQANNNGFFGGANGFWTGTAVGGTLASLFGGRQGGGWGWGNGWGGGGGGGMARVR
eukprot:763542-Hanusia_phi.AAC.3